MLGQIPRRLLPCFVLLFATLPLAVAQMGGSCPAGVQPDGFIDFSQLPSQPVVNLNQMSPPFSATLPVSGVAGLTVTVQIASLPGNGVPLFTTNGGSITINRYPLTNLPIAMTLTFNKPVEGISVLAQVNGRFPFDLSLDTDGNSITYHAENDFPDTPYAVPLQLRSVDLPFQVAKINFAHGQYSGITFSDLRVQSTMAPDLAKQVPTTGLQEWLRADAGVETDVQNKGVSAWRDQSGNGHDATQTASDDEPQSVVSTNCRRSIAFTNRSFLDFNLPINGWRDMTVFLVGRSNINPGGGTYGSENSAIFWSEDQPWGHTYVSPFQTHVDFRFGTTQPLNAPRYQRPNTVGQDYTVTRATHDESKDTLYVDGIAVFEQGGKLSTLAGTSGAGFLGRGLHDTYFNGEIAEILIYDRQLTPEEAARVEGYLRSKYGLR